LASSFSTQSNERKANKARNPVKGIVNLVKDLVSIPFSNDNLTTLMNRLENKYNIELYEIVDFLDDFYDCQEANSCTQIQNEIFSCYQILINMTKSDGFRKYIEKNYNSHEIHPDKIPKIPDHIDMLGKFNDLKQDEQDNILKLVWFILYCQIKKINIQNERSSFSDYYKLIKKIEDFKYSY
jgi:hypothetical protein